VADFDATYSAYAEFQRQMEFYWCLRWLQQERIEETTAFVLRENLVRFEHVPIFTRVADLPSMAPGARVRLGVGAIDLFAATLECRYAGVVTDDGAPVTAIEFEMDEGETVYESPVAVP
jgi:exoribonuclease-2